MSLSGSGSMSEEALTKIWTEVLRLPSIAVNANFFDIGGDSMKAMEVIVRAGEVLNVELPLMSFFEDPTIAHLASVVDELTGGRNTSKESLTKIWIDVLRLPSVEPEANFFDIGGDSMKAMEVIMRVSETLHVELPLMAFFEDPTIVHLASVLDELTGRDASPTIARVPGRCEFPLSYSQQVFWLLEQQNAGTGIYNTARIFHVRGIVDTSILERSLNELRRRHEILQVRFVQGTDGPVQLVDPGVPLRLSASDLSGLESDTRERSAQKLALETVREPFDLEAGPVVRARLVRLSGDDSLLCIAIHHVVSDGYTGSILLDELSTIYDAFADGQPSPLPDLEVHFTDYAAWERDSITDARLEDDLDYWRPVLQGAPTSIDLPVDHEGLPPSDRRGHLRSVTTTRASLERLQSFAQSNGATLFTVLTAGFRILLYRWSDQEDFLIGTIASNRSRSRTERMVGCFVNPLPLRNPVKNGESVLNIVNREKTAVMNAFAHQDCPFAKIVEAINPERNGNDNPLFNVALLLQSFPAIAVKGRYFEAEDINFDAEVGLIDLRFIAFETPCGLQIDCEYRSAAFESETVDHLLAAYMDVLTQIVTCPETEVSKVDISPDLSQRGAEHRRARHGETIAIAANFTAEPVDRPLAFWMDELRIPSRIRFAPFDQIFQQLLDPSSLLSANSHGVNLVFVQWRERAVPGEQARELAEALKNATARGAVPTILCVCPPTGDTEERVLAEELAGHAGVHVLYPKEILDLYPVDDYRDDYANSEGAIPYSPDFFIALASAIARRIHSMRSTPYKVIALDCDYTLWKGVCGEDGPLGVEVDAPLRALQEFMLRQHEAGMLLCLCSKNAEADVTAVFESNPGMLLRSEHIVSSRINWKSKSDNLKDLATALQLGLDSFILVDDNPLECAEVRSNCPGALVLELPSVVTKIPDALRNLWAFDHWTVTQEDRRRTELYQQEQKREQLRSPSGDLAQFLRDLELKIEIRPLRPDDIARAAQLTQRTNQFNCTTVRRSETEIELAIEGGAECLAVKVRDRFGDYGFVGLAIFTTQRKSLSVDMLLMSCRVLGRRVEHHILGKLGQIAMDLGLENVDVKFVPSAKNQPALDFLDSLGSEYRRPVRSEYLYRFPAAFASTAPDLAVANTQHSKLPKPVLPTLPVADRVDLERISLKLSDVKLISRAIHSLSETAGVQTGFLKSRSATEEILGGIWAMLLRTAPPGIEDDFFRLGGNSLLAVQSISRVRQTLGVEIPLRAMFERPTLGEFAQLVEAARRMQIGHVMPPLIKKPRLGPVPASFAQQRLWFIDQLEPDNPIYNIPQMTRIRGSLNVDAVQRSLSEIVRRHETLRTTFEAVDGRPQQVIQPAADFQVSLTDLSPLPEELRDHEIQRLALEEAVGPFNLQHGPVLRARLLRSAPDDHILLIVLHHIVGDRWSAGILAEEMEALYAAYVQGEPSPLVELPVQYGDFSTWQREWLQGPELEKQASYWRGQLAGAPAMLELPTDRPRPPLLTHKGATQAGLLPKGLVDKLTALSQSEGVTLFMTLLAALQTLLGRYSRQDDIVVGSPIAGRNNTEVEQLIGFFVNTLALRTDLSGNPAFRELLVRVKETTLDAYAHQDIPFEKLVEELQPERSLSYQPIFQVVFALQNAPQRSLELAGLQLERLPLHQGTSAFDMSWFATNVPEGMHIRVEYNVSLFDPATVGRAIGHLQNLLEAIVENPDQHIGEIKLLAVEERRQVEKASNGPRIDYPRERSLHQFIEEQVERTPDAAALVFQSVTLSYREINNRANRLANRLRSMGVGPDMLVGICVERSVEMVIGLLGILKAGGAYVPLDPEYPAERLQLMLADSEASVLLTMEHLIGVLPEHGITTICLDRDWPLLADESTANPAVINTGKSLAYVIYTSGSTGKPKGVPNVHEGIVNRLLWMQDTYDLGSADRILQKTPYSFDVSVWEFFWPLMTGACLVMAQPGGHKDPQYLVEVIRSQRITTLHFVPSMLGIFLDSDDVERCTSLQRVICSGEALPFELQQRFFVKLGSELHNLYGPTEASVDVTYWRCSPDSGRTTVPIGSPIWNTQIRILDPFLQPVPFGIPGELHIGGVGLARGYLKRPELTAEKFIPDRFSQEPGARLYKSGDLARMLPDGTVEYLGRIDHQVKIRGFRIELGEIEAILDSIYGIRQSIVMAREDQTGNKRLVAYIVSEPTLQDSTKTNIAEELQWPEITAQFRRTLGDKLPEFMVPTAFVRMEAIPLSLNGKANRSALPQPEFAREDSTSYVAPRTSTEERLVTIWSEVLRLPIIGANDNFFRLGGHSLLATQVISRIRQTTGVDLPLRILFEYPTVAELALKVEEIAVAATSMPATIQRVSRNAPLPVSFAQQRIWFLDQLEPGQALFNIPCAFRVDSTLDLEVLQRAIDAVVERHEVLRSNFVSRGGEPVQTVVPSIQVPVQLFDVSEWPKEESELEGMRVIGMEAQRPFDLACDPLLRVYVVRLSGDANILFLNIHHIISDRWSVTVLLSELSLLYDTFSKGRLSPLPELAVQYADFSAWQLLSAKSDDFERQLAYWMAELKGAPPLLELPTDRPRPPIASPRGDVARILLSPQLTQKLNELSQANEATLFMTLLAAFGVLLWRHSGQDDLIVGMPIANRNHPEIEGLIGLFANTLPVRLRMTGDPSFRDLLQRTKDTALSVYANQDVPFERLVEELQPERSLSYDALVQVSFILQNAPNEGVTFHGLELKHIPTDSKTSKGDLYFSLAEQGDHISGRLEFNTDIFDATTMNRFLIHYENLLEEIVRDPTQRASAIELLSKYERHQLLVEWNDTAMWYPRDKCLQELIEMQVARAPDRVAVVFEDKTLTFSQLNAKANQLAHHLRTKGVGPDTLVGVCLDRSLSMLIAMLGVLKAGGAYLPIDPAFPRERQAFMLEDAQAPVLLTSSSLSASMPTHSALEIFLDTGWDPIASHSQDNPSNISSSRHLAYVLYTSGSTGRPKGVMITHGNLVNFLESMSIEPGLTAEDTLVAVTTLSFDIAGLELWLPLYVGATVVIASRDVAVDGSRLTTLLRDSNATMMQATPATWNLLLEAGWKGELELVVLCGGEALSRSLVEAILPRCKAMWNMYGPTETTIWSTVSRVVADREITLGHPIGNTQILVVDKYHQLAPIGVTGELCIGGEGLSRGYLNRPELTSERFIANSFSTLSDSRLYKTGDLVRRLLDGSIEYIGRIDNQVKVRGYRIELGEIEVVLGTHPSIQENVVIVREDVAGDRRLVAYVIATMGAQIDPHTLRLWVKERLPDYMVPTAWVQMSRLPLTPNGKIDRNQLPAPASIHAKSSSEFRQVRTPTEDVLSSIWSEILRLDHVELQDDFFDLGGHSLLATQVVSRILKAFHVDLPLRTLFEYPCIGELAKQIDASQRGTSAQKTPPITPVERTRTLPLSFAQQRLWFMDQFEPNNALYNVPYIVRLKGDLRASCLERSIQEIVRRHESLRTRFEMFEDEPVQIIDEHVHVPLVITDLTNLPISVRLAETRRRVVEELQRPFNLKTGPLLRTVLFRLEEQDHALVINTHHIISDRWSLGVLSQELALFYEAFVADRSVSMPELSIQYADYAVWQRQFLSGSVLYEQLNYWREELDGAPEVLELPVDRPRIVDQEFWGATCNRALPQDLTTALHSMSRKRSATFFMTLMAGFQILLSKLARQDDIVIGTDLANRTQLDTEQLIGFFVNLLPIRAKMMGDLTFEKILENVRETSLGAYAHQDIPFDKLVEELRPERSLTHNPLVQILFVMQNTPPTASAFGGLTTSPLGVSSSSRFDLVLFINDPDGTPFATWMYNPNLFDTTTIERMSKLYELLLQEVAVNPQISLSKLRELLDDAEQQERAAIQIEFQQASRQKLKQVKRRVGNHI